jgi:hypothetical protein
MNFLFVGSNDNEQRYSIKCVCGCPSWYVSTEFLFQCSNCSNRVEIEKIKWENDL